MLFLLDTCVRIILQEEFIKSLNYMQNYSNFYVKRYIKLSFLYFSLALVVPPL